MGRLTHFDSRGKLINNAKLVWATPDISPKFALVQELRFDVGLFQMKYIRLGYILLLKHFNCCFYASMCAGMHCNGLDSASLCLQRWKPGGRELFCALMNVYTPQNKVAYMLCLSAGLEMLHGGIIRQAVKNWTIQGLQSRNFPI